ncbi:replication initiation protein [Gandjariella thermophila]|uniref:Replication initiation protein n=1 Tax=Gandjariella thermophila TaxID=1931992 RepID=A0A4D4J327_9PSEU|nr:replication initiation protein [Gandjariella thermophila]
MVSRLATEDEQLGHFLASMGRDGLKRWRRQVAATGGCAKPIRLAGSWSAQTSTGHTLAEYQGGVFVACNNRRLTVCPSCAQVYASDTFHLVRSGLTGGKGVPESVAGHVRAFATLTAPSFGPVHTQPATRTGRPRPCACGRVHSDYDAALGQPIDPAGYDYVGAVLWQAHSTELWRRFTITLARQLAGALGVSATKLGGFLRVSYAKVAEYQRRGLVHFHAVIRVDGPAGPDGPPPPDGVTVELLCRLIRSAAGAVAVVTPESDAVGVRTLRWGRQVDAEPITAGSPGDPAGLARVAGYIAKYATKGTGAISGVDRRIRHEAQIANLEVSEHHRAMIATAWRLGGLAEFAGLNLRRWAHMLGFRGHFLTKSRRYSVTFTTLRAARAEHRQAQALQRLGIADHEDLVVVNDWRMVGVGYRSQAERELAEAVSARLRPRPLGEVGADG